MSVFDPPPRKCTYFILTVLRMMAGRLRTHETHTFPPAEKQIPNPWEGKVLAGYLRVVAPSGEDTAVSPGCRHLASGAPVTRGGVSLLPAPSRRPTGSSATQASLGAGASMRAPGVGGTLVPSPPGSRGDHGPLVCPGLGPVRTLFGVYCIRPMSAPRWVLFFSLLCSHQRT